MQRFTNLNVCQRSYALVLEIYRATSAFPAEERFGLVSQMRRAAVSVPDNIAEGSQRDGHTDYARFLNIAQGSLPEAQCLLLLARHLGYLPTQACESILAEADQIARMLHVLRTKVAGHDAPR
jgi:four helix bundle protein